MTNHKNSKINWLNIVFDKDFQNYLDLSTLINISRLSKIVRDKLNPRLFNSIGTKVNRRYIKDVAREYYDIVSLSLLNSVICSDTNELKKSLRVEKVLNGICHDLHHVKSFVSKLYLDGMNYIGYHLFHIFKLFNNLKILKLNDCTIPYSTLVKIGVLFPNLISIELTSVLLIKLPTDIADSEDFIIPPHLSYLNIFKVKVANVNLLSELHELLFDEDQDEYLYRLTLPKVSIPSLKKLDFIDDYEDDCDLEEFLDVNPNLESLKIESLYLDRAYNFNSLKSLDIFRIECYDNEPKFTIQESIKELIVFIEDNTYFENFAKLCKLCPNIEMLKLLIMCGDSIQQSFDKFLKPILFNSPKVKTLHLEVYADENEVIDINNFSHIENITFEVDLPYLLNYKFDKCKSLKKIQFHSEWFEVNNEDFIKDFKEIRNRHKNWAFKLCKHKVKGQKILQ
jgi:hypothetical protein